MLKAYVLGKRLISFYVSVQTSLVSFIILCQSTTRRPNVLFFFVLKYLPGKSIHVLNLSYIVQVRVFQGKVD